MKAKLYGQMGNVVGTVTLQSQRVYPKLIKLDESPRGGQRLFVNTEMDTYKEYPEMLIPLVKLDTPSEDGEVSTI